MEKNEISIVSGLLHHLVLGKVETREDKILHPKAFLHSCGWRPGGLERGLLTLPFDSYRLIFLPRDLSTTAWVYHGLSKWFFLNSSSQVVEPGFLQISLIFYDIITSFPTICVISFFHSEISHADEVTPLSFYSHNAWKDDCPNLTTIQKENSKLARHLSKTHYCQVE